eukprot:TRINITY_DN465_c0_g1_i18.p1 TRINITY_DN465_c0_g1~~TRINITY_DN465_c0_g1_i18.p1  ORF type:complete len:187 (-),score=38.06 TRINITY_DN465_c0_g1_i18:98-658(-)
MCIRDRYMGNKAIVCVLVCALIASGLASKENMSVEFLTGYASYLGLELAPKTLSSINDQNFSIKKILMCTYLISQSTKYQHTEGAYCLNYFFNEAIQLNRNLIANEANLGILFNTARSVFSDSKKFNQASEFLDKGLKEDIRELMTQIRQAQSGKQAGIILGKVVLKYWSILDNLNDPNVRKYITQ